MQVGMPRQHEEDHNTSAKMLASVKRKQEKVM
jgi:hypothetical protein